MLIIDAVLAVKMPFLMNHVLDELFMIYPKTTIILSKDL